MVFECPKCRRTVPDDAVYCPYCGRGLQASARSVQVSIAGALMIVATAASFIILVLSIQALDALYNWYPPLVAQMWFFYDQLLAILVFLGFILGLATAIFSLSRMRYKWTMLLAVLCTISGGGALAISLVIPNSQLWSSILYYFLPVFFSPLVGTVLIYLRKEEFQTTNL